MNTEPFLCDISKPKLDSETDTIILVMTWSGLSSAKLASRFPYWPLSGPDNPWETSLGNFGPLGASQSMARPVSSQLGYLKAILVLWGTLQISLIKNLSISELHFVLQISTPSNSAQICFCIQNLHIWISVFRNPFLGSQDIKQIQKPHFFRHPVYTSYFIIFIIDIWLLTIDSVCTGSLTLDSWYLIHTWNLIIHMW